MAALGCTRDLLASILMQLVLELPPPAGASLTLLACCLLLWLSQPLQAAAAYLEALQTLQTPLTPQSTWEEQGGSRVPESTAYSVLNDRRREQVRGRGSRSGQPECGQQLSAQWKLPGLRCPPHLAFLIFSAASLPSFRRSSLPTSMRWPRLSGQPVPVPWLPSR